MITILALLLVAGLGAVGVLWPVIVSVRRPWAIDAPSGEQEALRQEQVAALDALRDLALDYKLGNLTREDYRALAAPLQQRARRALDLQKRQASQPSLALAELDARLEAQIRAMRRVSTATPLPHPAATDVPLSEQPSNGHGKKAEAMPLASIAPAPSDTSTRAADLPSVRPAAPEDEVAEDEASETPNATAAPGPSTSRRGLWALAAVVTLAWIVGIIWLYTNSRAGQENQMPVAELPGVPIQAIAATDDGLFVGEPGGLHGSADGASWRTLPPQGDVRAVVVSGADGASLVAAGPGGVWRSSDKGATWQQIASNPPVELLALGAMPGPSGVLVGADESSLWASEDGGETWETLGADLPGRPRALAVSSMAIFLGTDRGVFRTEDGGQSWITMNGSGNGVIISTDVRALAYDEEGDTLFAGTPAGLSFMNMRSPGGWGQRSLRASVTALATDPTRSSVLWAGASDGRIFRSADRGVTWR